MYSPSIQNLISSFKNLPSIGQRTAERFVFYLLKSGKKEVTELMLALKELIETVKSCEVCWNFADTSPCQICQDKKRDHTTICVITDPQDLMVIERTGEYKGVYHVLRGLLDAGDEESLRRIKVNELVGRLSPSYQPASSVGGEGAHGGVAEVILALNPDLAGETTMLYLEKEIKKNNPSIKVSRLARGLPMGADLRYADDITLGSAIKNRIAKG